MHTTTQHQGDPAVVKSLDAKYLTDTPTETHPQYGGRPKAWLDRDIITSEVLVALHELNTCSAAGLDLVTNKTLRNLDNASIETLTRYFSECWPSGKLPRQWKSARTILIPKPGKPPDIANLHPISLTSCVGKVLDHVVATRRQEYLEKDGLYPDTMIGFRHRLSTQDAMLQLKQETIDNKTQESKVILGLHLQSAFDKIKHSAIIAQPSRLNIGVMSYNYIKDFLTNRTVELHAGDLKLPERKLGSMSTQQGSVISPLLFNLVMIGVARALVGTGVRHTIYADDIICGRPVAPTPASTNSCKQRLPPLRSTLKAPA